MEIKTAVFYLLATILVLASLRVVTAKNPVHAALFLVLAFFTAGGTWLLLQAEFLGIALVLVYVGAVMVLFLFVVMMLDINLERVREGFWKALPLGGVVGGLMAAEIGMVLYTVYGGVVDMPVREAAENYSNTKAIGLLLYSDYLFPFELAGIVLLVAIVAAIALTYRGSKASKYTDPAKQIRVRAADRVRVVQMPAEPQE